MSLDIEQNEHCRILHKETLEVFESLGKLGDRFHDPGHRVTDAEAQQSIEYLRADLDRLSNDINLARDGDTVSSRTEESAGSALLLPAILGGLALGAVIEK
jgi:hypothetical protein